MPTEKPRISVTMDKKTLNRLEKYQRENLIKTQSKAILTLVKFALDDLDWTITNGNPSPYSDDACNLAMDYDGLDRWGQQAVRELINTEMARMEDDARFLEESAPEPEPKVIPLFWSAPAAGIASPIFGEDYDNYELKPEDPQGAMFAVKVSGDSMEPYFPDGSTVFCTKDPLERGDIGVFSIDGGAVIKQYYKDPAGFVYLFSLNRKRADADVLIVPSSGRTLACLGRVITKQRYPVPGKR